MPSTAANYRCVWCAEELPPIDANVAHYCQGFVHQTPLMDRVARLEAQIAELMDNVKPGLTD